MRNRTRTFLILSLLINALLVGAIGFMLHRLGGWKYALYKFQNDEAGLYTHRKQLFTLLPERQNAVIFLGDSQTEQAEWAELLSDSVSILNRGIVGDHVDGIWQRLDEVLRHKPSKVFLCVGINDLLLGKPLEDIEKRYREIVQKIRKQQPNTYLALESVLPINNQVKKIGIENTAIIALNEQIYQIAKDYALPYVDIYPLLTDANGNLSPQFTDDGLHLNGQGYMVWKKALEPTQ